MPEKSDLPDPLELDPRGEKDQRFDVNNPNRWVGAVLLADEIRFYCQQTPSPIITPFDNKLLRPASYNLRLGEEIRIGGIDTRLDAGAPTILEPHQVAILSTEESLNIPRFLIARWSIKVRKIYEGMLWTGGLQVDPGWRGRLFCPMYNLSERPILLRRLDSFFTIDFVRTTAISPEYIQMRDVEGLSDIWFKTMSNPRLADFEIHRIHSAPYESLKELEETRQFRQTYAVGLGILFAAVGSVAAGLTIFTVTQDITPDPTVTLDNPWFAAAVAAAGAAFFLSIVSLAFAYGIYNQVAGLKRQSSRPSSAIRELASSAIADFVWDIVTLPLNIAARLIAWPFVRIWKFWRLIKKLRGDQD